MNAHGGCAMRKLSESQRLQKCREWWEDYCHSEDGDMALSCLTMAGMLFVAGALAFTVLHVMLFGG